jgi:hypothetical protein
VTLRDEVQRAAEVRWALPAGELSASCARAGLEYEHFHVDDMARGTRALFRAQMDVVLCMNHLRRHPLPTSPP